MDVDLLISSSNVRDWQREKFEQEAFPHRQAIRRSAAHYLLSARGADEVVQEVFLAAWRSFDRFAAGTNCRAWLHQILRYKILHHQRHERRFPEASPEQAAALEARGPVSSELTDHHLIQALQRLPEKYRVTLLLVDLHELTYLEAAQRLQIPVGTVMSRLSRARRKMRDLLEPPVKTGVGRTRSGNWDRSRQAIPRRS